MSFKLGIILFEKLYIFTYGYIINIFNLFLSISFKTADSYIRKCLMRFLI